MQRPDPIERAPNPPHAPHGARAAEPAPIPGSAALIEWRPIPWAPGYYANTAGQIRGAKGFALSPFLHRTGYHYVTVREKKFSVHRLVCEAFHGPPPTPKHHAAHGDGNRLNNCPANLRWATAQENVDDQRRHGTLMLGEGHVFAKLTESQAGEIKRIYGHFRRLGRRVPNGTLSNLAAKFGVSTQTIKSVARGRNWRHVVVDLPFMLPPEVAP